MNKLTAHRIYEFDEFRIDVEHLMLSHHSREISLVPKAVETLVVLIEHRGRIVSKDELLQAVWPDTVVEESNLFLYLSLLRKALGDQKDGKPYVETLRRRGYRFNGDVRLVEETEKNHVVTEALHSGSREFATESGQLYVFKDWDRGKIVSGKIGSASAAVPALIDVSSFNDVTPPRNGTADGEIPFKPTTTHAPTEYRRSVVNRSRRKYFSAVSVVAILMIGSAAGLFSWWNPQQKQHTYNPDAVDYYNRARYSELKLTEEGLRQALVLYDQAIKADPNYALAYAHMADTYRTLGATGFERLKDVFPNVRRLATRAVELDPSLAEAHVQLGNVQFYDRNPSAAETTYKKAIELDPTDPQAHIAYAFLLLDLKRVEEALAEARRARELGSRTLIVLSLESDILRRAGLADEAMVRAKNVLNLDPNFWVAHLHLGWAYVENNQWNEAVTEFAKVRQLAPGTRLGAVQLAKAYLEIGNRPKALEILDEIELRSRKEGGPFVGLASIYNSLGQKDKALDLLEKAVEGEEPLQLIKTGKGFDNLRSEPRFKALLERIERLAK
jgi:DNA-binding winged helix-turn-helix (wHTH) protein/tetratricopeptide (TPR) repeat protein